MAKSNAAGLQNSGTDSNEAIELSQRPVQRHNFMQAVAALADTRFDQAGYDINNVEGCGPIDGTYLIESFSPAAVNVSGDSAVASWYLEDRKLEDRAGEAFYNQSGILLAFEETCEKQNVRAGSRSGFKPEQGKELAAALFQAVEELQLRREITDAE